MIETERAVERLDDILAVPGIDAVYVGPADLSITLGQPPRMDNGGAFEEARVGSRSAASPTASCPASTRTQAWRPSMPPPATR